MLLSVTKFVTLPFIEWTFSHPAQAFTLTPGQLCSACPCVGTLFTHLGPDIPCQDALFMESFLLSSGSVPLCRSPPDILPLPALYTKTPSSPEVRLCFYGDTLFLLLVLQCLAPNYLPTQTLSSPPGQDTNSPMWTPSYTWSSFSPTLSSVAFPSPPPSSLHFVELFSSFLMLVGSSL